MAWQDPLHRGGHIPPLSLSPHVRVTTVDRCANQHCPNRQGEGRMVVLAVHTGREVKRDVALILCAPCGEYLARMIR